MTFISGPKAKTATLFQIIAAVAIVSLIGFLFAEVLSSLAPLDGDEADHANPALELYFALKSYSPQSIFEAITRQSFYPPVNSIGVAASYLLFSPSLASTRLVSLIWFICTILILYRLTFDFLKSRCAGFVPAGAALVAAVLTTFSPIHVYNSVLCMLEPLAVALVALLLLVLNSIEGKKNYSVFPVALIALLVATIGLEKYSVAVPVAAAIFSLAVVETFRRRFNFKHWLTALVFLGIPLGIWLLVTDRDCIVSYVQDQPSYRHGILSAKNLLFDISSYFRVFTVGYSTAAFVLVLAFVGGWRYRTSAVVQFSVLLIFWGVFVMLLSTNNGSRHLLFLVPCIWFLSSLGMAGVIGFYTSGRVKLVGAALGVVFVVEALLWARLLPATLKRRFEGTSVHHRLTEEILDQLTPDAKVLVQGTNDLFSIEYLRWAAGVKWDRRYSSILIDEYPLRMGVMQQCRRTVPLPLSRGKGSIRPLANALKLGYYDNLVKVFPATSGPKKKPRSERKKHSVEIRPDRPWCGKIYRIEPSTGETILLSRVGERC